MGQIKKDEADQQQGEGYGHCPVNAHGGNPEDKGVDGPAHQKPAHVGGAGVIDVKMVEDENDSQGYPESAVGDKGAVAEVVAALELLEPGKHLGQAAEDKGKGDNGPDVAQSYIVHLQQHGGEGKSRKPDYRRVALGCYGIGHEMYLLVKDNRALQTICGVRCMRRLLRKRCRY